MQNGFLQLALGAVKFGQFGHTHFFDFVTLSKSLRQTTRRREVLIGGGSADPELAGQGSLRLARLGTTAQLGHLSFVQHFNL